MGIQPSLSALRTSLLGDPLPCLQQNVPVIVISPQLKEAFEHLRFAVQWAKDFDTPENSIVLLDLDDSVSEMYRCGMSEGTTGDERLTLADLALLVDSLKKGGLQ